MRRSAGVCIAIAFACVGQAKAQTPAPHEHSSFLGSPEAEIESLAQNLDNMVKACSAMAVRGGSQDKAVRRPEQYAIDQGLLKFLEEAPEGLEQAANPKFGSARFAQWFDPHATIYVISYDASPLCRAFVLRSEWAKGVRPKLFELLQIDNFWKATEIDSKIDSADGPIVRSVFMSKPGVNVQPMITITANDGPATEGQPQMTIAVSLVAKGED